jgi:uncharacterized membrane protein YgcG
MMRKLFASMFFLLFALLFISCSQKQNADAAIFPVTDSVDVLTSVQEDSLTKELLELEESIGSQMAILLIGRLKGVPIERYSLDIANRWKLGRKDYNDGILITVSVYDRMIRIEVGYGLEKIVKDEIAANIIREEIAPNFKEEKYYEGLHAAVTRIKALIKANKDLIGTK